MPRPTVEEVLARLDGPVVPRPEFAAALHETLEAELESPRPESVPDEARPRPVRRGRWSAPWRGTRPRPTVALATAVVLSLVAVVVFVPVRPEPSAADVIAEARARFGTLPPFEATVVRREFGASVAAETGLESAPDLEVVRRIAFRDERRFRVDVLSNTYDGIEAALAGWAEPGTGSFVVSDGRYLARYLAREHEVLVAGVADHPVDELRYAATELLAPRTHRPDRLVGTARADTCRVLPDEPVAGRDARRIRCDGPEMGGMAVDAWLDRETGFLLRKDVEGDVTSAGLLDVAGTVLHVRSITFGAVLDDADLELSVPEGARVVWVGGDPVPGRFRAGPAPGGIARVPLERSHRPRRRVGPNDPLRQAVGP